MAERPGSDFDSFVTAQGPRFVKLAYLLTGNVADADDLVQESLTRAFVAWSQIQRVGNPDGYMRQLMVNTNLRRFRRHRVTEILDGRDHDHGRPQGEFAVIDDRHHLARALRSLPQRPVTAQRRRPPWSLAAWVCGERPDPAPSFGPLCTTPPERPW
jgi:DNA-directed RNA polymerase specialized sigma24 family protein